VAVNFPHYVQTFTEHTKSFLNTWQVKLEPNKDGELARSYRAREPRSGLPSSLCFR
jgi:hypothetical protein